MSAEFEKAQIPGDAGVPAAKPLGPTLGLAQSKGWGLWGGLILLWAVIYLPGLGSEGGITQKDEFNVSLRTQVESYHSGRFFTPFLDGQPRFRKPPLFYWALIAAKAAFGGGLFVSRLPSALSALALALGAAVLARGCSDRRGREMAAGVLVLSSVGAFAMGRMALLDVPMSALVLWAVVCLLRWMETDRWGWALLAGLLAGLSAMAKGPIGPYVVVVVALARFIVFRRGRWAFEHWRAALAGLAVLLLASLFWPTTMAAGWGRAFWATVFEELAYHTGVMHLGGIESSLHALGGLAGQAVPWALPLLVAAGAAWARRKDGTAREDLWLGLWVLCCVLPFALPGVSLERYMAPALPALAVLAVRRFDGATLWGRLSLWATAATGLPVLVFAAVVGFWFRVGPWWAWLAASATIAGAAYAWALRRDLVAGSALAGVWFMLVGGILYPCLDINRLPDALTPEVVGSRPVYLFNSSRPAYLATRLDRPVLAIHARLPGNGVPQEIAEEKMTDALDVLPRAVRENAVIAVIGEQERRFLFLLNVIGVAPRTTLMAWRSLGTRGTFLQIARKGATFDDWRQAWELRDLSVLGETCRLYADFAPLAGGSIER